MAAPGSCRRDNFRRRRARRQAGGIDEALALALGAELARGGRGSLAAVLPPAFVGSGPVTRHPDSLGRRLLRGLLSALLGLHLLWIGTTSLLALGYRFTNPSVTVLMAYRAWVDGWELARPRPLHLASVPAWQRAMLVSVEDYKFYRHFGLDFEAIVRAWQINARLAEPLYGGSTLSMQVARTLFLVPVKSYLRKYLEVIVALELELILGKDRILELYFGYAEWGRGIFGIEAAARRWYGKGARALTREEGARLIAILSSPIRYGPEDFGRSLILRERLTYLLGRYVLGPPTSGTAVPSPGEGALPPAGEILPPAGEILPTAGETLPPAGETLPPASETLPPAGETPPPAGDTRPPTGEPLAPGTEASPPPP